MMSVIRRKKNSSSFEGTREQRLKILENSNAAITNKKPIFHLINEVVQSEAAEFSGHNHHQYSYCFLKSCHLCHKPLSLDKEVYMYRGDVGFCSVECRNRQMYLDEMKKIEISTRRILASFHQGRRDGGRLCEIRGLRGVVPTAAPPIFISNK